MAANLRTDDTLAAIAHNTGPGMSEADREMLQSAEDILFQDEFREYDMNFIEFVRNHIANSLIPHYPNEATYLNDLAGRIKAKREQYAMLTPWKW